MTKKYRKHQKLPIREAKWKWEYLHSKYLKGVNITKYIESEMVRTFSLDLINARENPEAIEAWVENHLNPALVKSLDMAVRARRKRNNDNENLIYAKKSIFLEFEAWEALSTYAKEHNVSLSEAILLLFKEKKN
ncbi:hypothetical protein CJP74_02455 [Psittacicella melopsittaci]|uniref:Uncharacterized protein n=1 Tax=Psittacicella melopsittaci TaxID=2028576 RepID=A0A3A1YB16_9GAMM|nr:Ter macrodomain-binding protein MatP [Psittacicella melopsittaci]RIY33307.1 hypothetical protein CJP74_02455 [Psittacicella melopsittaci]